MKSVRAKVSKIANKLVNVTRRTYGRKGKYIKFVVDSVVKPTVLRGSEG